jgi:hypothetical protein
MLHRVTHLEPRTSPVHVASHVQGGHEATGGEARPLPLAKRLHVACRSRSVVYGIGPASFG